MLGLQKELDRRDVEHRLSIQRLEAENKRLRDLHYLSGVPPEALDAYVWSVDNSVMSKKIAIPAVQRPTLQRLQSTCARPSSAPDASSEGALESKSPPTEAVDRLQQSDEPKEEAAELPPFCACSPEDSGSLPINERVLNTTFCTIAEKLVDQYNARGVDVSEIQQKLRQGFFRSSSEEGCRVQNQILFQVLDEISGH